jgi:hypothetical protein
VRLQADLVDPRGNASSLPDQVRRISGRARRATVRVIAAPRRPVVVAERRQSA